MKNIIGNYRIEMLSKLSNIENSLVSQEIYQFLRILNVEYPAFKNWYWSLFDNEGFILNNREILYCKADNSIVAVAILKFNIDEKKICTFRVKKKYQGQGIGTMLMEKSLECLQTDKPLITVYKSKAKQFEKLFKYYNFKQEQSLKNYYRCFNTELSFNGILPEKKIWLNKLDVEDLKKALKEFVKKSKSENIDEMLEDFIKYYFGKDLLRKYTII